MTAVFLAETAPKRLAGIVKPAVELLAGIPSVVYGLLGILILNPFIYKLEMAIFKDDPTHQFTGGSNLISAVLVLSVMILPTVINISESALRAVPQHYKQASLALGATHIQTIFKVIIPAAKSGIVTAVVLGVGRAIGEAMAISLVAGNGANMPLPFNSVRFLTTAVVSEMSYAADTHKNVLFTIGLVLFTFIMIINLVLNKVMKGGKKNADN
jgi:phosphate transport system permease protein